MGSLAPAAPKESTLLPSMPELLERAGFVLRGPRRATCAHCEGRDKTTVGFTPELAHCHRCGWRSNTLTLARELGILGNDPALLARLRREQIDRWKREAPRREFNAWRERQIRKLTSEYRELGGKAELARRVLAVYPDEELAWQALADFHHKEAKLLRALDVLIFARASPWLERDATEEELFGDWREANRE